MTEDEAYWRQLIDGLRAGDPQAASEFYSRYGPLMERLAAGHLASGLLRRVDPDDVANSACRTFLRRIEGGQFVIEGKDNLWNLLCAITLAKTRKKVRFHKARKRAVDREIHVRSSEDTEPLDVAAGGGPSPAEAAAFADQFKHLLDRLDDEERQIVLMKLERRTHDDIAAALGTSERTVRRILKRVEAQLTEAFEGGD